MSQMAFFSGAMPVTAVYFDTPLMADFAAASSTNLGGSKSGSPTPKANTSTPVALSSLARALMARVALGATTLRRFAKAVGTFQLLFRDLTVDIESRTAAENQAATASPRRTSARGGEKAAKSPAARPPGREGLGF